MARCSVIVPTYRQKDLLRMTLDTLSRQSISRDDYEILVVDNNADGEFSETTRSLAGEYGAIYVRETMPGAGAARNAGIQQAQGDILIFVDDDVEVCADFLSQHLKMHSKEDKAVVVGRIVEQPETEDWFSRFLTQCQVINQQIAEGSCVDFRQFYGANASVRKHWVVKAGLFDRGFKRRQDGELAYRLKQLGLSFRTCVGAVAVHHSRFSPASYLRRARDNGFYLAMFWTKHPEMKVIENERQYRGLKPIVARLFGRVLFSVGWLVYPITPYFLHKGFMARVLVGNVKGIRDFEKKAMKFE